MTTPCPSCGRSFIRQQPSTRPDYVIFTHADGSKCFWPARSAVKKTPPPPPQTGSLNVFSGQPVRQPAGSAPADRQALDTHVRNIVDHHMQEILRELGVSKVTAVGVVVGVMHDNETSVSWCISDELLDEGGKPLPAETVAHQIALDVERATR